ncbi:hypothetical protein TEA_000361 [Camellia sinensis var. sinensis]|uniref:Uncharacterized protein n=1 Tax=Camellia sinensis var. sinensis TaxID=542762 RepID=A0A4S4DVL4_CAMSN|nr:hypothetical protein TEA_000361 [Camellia sinensis var. sinensis]
MCLGFGVEQGSSIALSCYPPCRPRQNDVVWDIHGSTIHADSSDEASTGPPTTKFLRISCRFAPFSFAESQQVSQIRSIEARRRIQPLWCAAVLNYEEDVAAYTIKAATDRRAYNRVIFYRPHLNTVSQLDLLSSWEDKTGRGFKRTYVSEESIVKLSERNKSHFLVMFSLEVNSGFFSTELPAELISTTELKLKNSYQWQPLQTFVTISQHFMVEAKGIRLRGTVNDCNSIMQQLLYNGEGYGAVLMVKINDMGNYGCYPDCEEKMSMPLFAEANINLMRKRPMKSLVAHCHIVDQEMENLAMIKFIIPILLLITSRRHLCLVSRHRHLSPGRRDLDIEISLLNWKFTVSNLPFIECKRELVLGKASNCNPNLSHQTRKPVWRSSSENVRDDTSMKSGSGSHGGHDEDEHFDPLLDENEFTILAGESQDPTDTNPNFGDFWDSLTGLITEKMSQDKQDKGKGKAA